MPKYKVAEMRTKSFTQGRMTPRELEELLNRHAAEGWALDRIVSGEVTRRLGLSHKEDALLVIFRKDS